MVNCYRRFVKDYASIIHQLTLLTRKDTSFQWSAECQQAFRTLIDKLVNSQLLTLPD